MALNRNQGIAILYSRHHYDVENKKWTHTTTDKVQKHQMYNAICKHCYGQMILKLLTKNI